MIDLDEIIIVLFTINSCGTTKDNYIFTKEIV